MEGFETIANASSNRKPFSKAPTSVSITKNVYQWALFHVKRKVGNRDNCKKFRTQDGRWSGQQNQQFTGKYCKLQTATSFNKFPELIPLKNLKYVNPWMRSLFSRNNTAVVSNGTLTQNQYVFSNISQRYSVGGSNDVENFIEQEDINIFHLDLRTLFFIVLK